MANVFKATVVTSLLTDNRSFDYQVSEAKIIRQYALYSCNILTFNQCDWEITARRVKP